MDFSQTGFSFDHYPSNQKAFGLNMQELEYFCGVIVASIRSRAIANNFHELELNVNGPLNVIMGLSKESVVVGINTSKATLNSKALIALKESSTSVMPEDSVQMMMKQAGLVSLGTDSLTFYGLPIKYFDTLRPALIELSRGNGQFEESIQPLIKWVAQAKNVESNDRTDLLLGITAAADKYLSNLRREMSVMQIEPKFKARDIVVKRNMGFYVLPFTHFPLEAFGAIQKGITDNKVDCEIVKSEDRFDPSRGNSIIENIWQDICMSRFVIADLSERNPNVFYELGICDTIGKTVIPICSNRSRKEDYPNGLPFDVAGEYTVFYDEDFNGYTALQGTMVKRIRAILETSRHIVG